MLKQIVFKGGLLCLLVCITAFKVSTNKVVYITLQNQALTINPKEYYIAGVVDGRKSATSIGNLQPFVNDPLKQTQPYDIDLKGGIAAVKNFISYALPAVKERRPVIIKLKVFNVTESPLNNGLVKGGIKLSASFFLQKGEDLVHLVDYNTVTTYQRRPGPAQYIEPLLRSALSNSLVYLNNWMNAQAGVNIKLAKAVKVSFKNYNEPIEGDTIYYNVNRPLTWNDFKGRQQRGSKNGAEIFPAIGYDESVTVSNAVVNVVIGLKVFVPKSANWVNMDVVRADGINHEQRHFDIARLVAEHFKQNILAEKLPPDNYDGTINMAYFDALRELHDMEKKYDSDTAHSTNTYQQQLWDDRIDKELIKLGIKKAL